MQSEGGGRTRPKQRAARLCLRQRRGQLRRLRLAPRTLLRPSLADTCDGLRKLCCAAAQAQQRLCRLRIRLRLLLARALQSRRLRSRIRQKRSTVAQLPKARSYCAVAKSSHSSCAGSGSAKPSLDPAQTRSRKILQRLPLRVRRACRTGSGYGRAAHVHD